jgi:hypothetical protein
MNDAGKAVEPPSSSLPLIFTIRQDSRENWVAQERSGLCGRLFTDRAGALKFVKFEVGSYPHAVVWVSGIYELNTSSASGKWPEEPIADGPHRSRRAA